MRFETKAIHAGGLIDKAYHSVSTPIYATSTFCHDEPGEHRGFDYSRKGNPTVAGLERRLAALEGGAAACATSSGMAAVTAALFLFKPGDHVIAGHDVFGGTYHLFDAILTPFGLSFSFVDMRDLANIRAAVMPNTRCIWIETPSNPLVRLTDLAGAVEIARKKDLLTIVDSTFATPYFQRPFEHGVDLVVHSTTKYIAGHSDVVGGVVVARDAGFAERVRSSVAAMGMSCSPFDAFLVLRGIRTLAYRMEGHQRNALRLAESLRSNNHVKKVYYPGLRMHPQYGLAHRQMTGFSGMLSFDIDSSKVDLRGFFKKLKLFRLAVSLGGPESLIELPWTMSHAGMAEDARHRAGLTPETIRVSVGLEHTDDLIEDLAQALT